MHHASSIMHLASCISGRRVRFGMLTVLTNIRSNKALYHASCFKHHASCILHCRQEAEIWYVDCSHKYKINQGVMVGGRRSLGEDDLWWKTTFVGSLHAAYSAQQHFLVYAIYLDCLNLEFPKNWFIVGRFVNIFVGIPIPCFHRKGFEKRYPPYYTGSKEFNFAIVLIESFLKSHL